MTMISYRAKKGTWGGQIRRQLRSQRYIELSIIVKVLGVKWASFMNFYYYIEKENAKNCLYSSSLIFFFEDATCYHYSYNTLS